ncbi:MAG: thiolase family protein [Promethearchaeota archaeon]|jgi:acetyl-CoA acetyltransferase
MTVSDKVYVIGVGMTRFAKLPGRTIKSMTGESVENALKDCNLSKGDLQAAWFSNSGWGQNEYQHCIRGQVALSTHGIDKIPITNIENACAGGSTAFHNAWMSIKAGVYDVALAVGAEKMYFDKPPRVKSGGIPGMGPLSGFISGTDVEDTLNMIGQLKKQIEEGNRQAAKEKVKDEKKEGEKPKKKKDHSIFMDFYAMGARAHMKQYGTTQRQIATIAAKNHNNSTMNPLAQYTFPQTIEQVMEDYVVAYPLTRAMCAPTGDGSASAIICSEQFLIDNPSLKDRAILIRASILKSGSRKRDKTIERASTSAYEIAGLGPEDINVAEVHDATAYAELSIIEELGFCPVGKGGPFVESGATELDGTIPVNPSGGLLARGHPIGASGVAQMYELVTHLRGEAGERQVKDPKFALAQNGGGTLGPGEAAVCVHIFEKI